MLKSYVGRKEYKRRAGIYYSLVSLLEHIAYRKMTKFLLIVVVVVKIYRKYFVISQTSNYNFNLGIFNIWIPNKQFAVRLRKSCIYCALRPNLLFKKYFLLYSSTLKNLLISLNAISKAIIQILSLKTTMLYILNCYSKMLVNADISICQTSKKE